MAAFMIILTYVSKELSYDKFWPDHENIYRVSHKPFQHGELKDHRASTYIPVAALAQQTFPEVQQATRFRTMSGNWPEYVQWVGADNQEIEINTEQYLVVDSVFMDVFPMPFIKGRVADFRASNTTVITRSKANEIFGPAWETAASGSNLDPIGKVFYIKDNQKDFFTSTIVGVIEDFPDNTHFSADIINHNILYKKFGDQWWFAGETFYTYIKVFPDTDIGALEAKLPSIFVNQHLVNQGYQIEFPLQPISRIHLYSQLTKEIIPGGSALIVYVLMIVAGLILLLAYVNYVNLTTVQSMERAKEVGLRKVIGARRRELIQQFLLHTLVINAFSACLVMGILGLVLPIFNQYLGTNLELVLYQYGVPSAGLFGGVFLLIYLLGVILSGMYPAFILSAFKPTAALRGKIGTQYKFRGIKLRNSLIVFQFSISILLMIGTLAVFRQTQYMQSQQLGFDMEKMVVIENSFSQDSTLASRMKGFKNQIEQHSSFSMATISSSVPGNEQFWNFTRENAEDFKQYTRVMVDNDFLNCYGLELIAGRWLDEDLAGDQQKVVINEEAVKWLGFHSAEEALQAKLKDYVHPEKNIWEIIGVVKNHHQSSLHTGVDPIVFLLNTAEFYWKNEEGEDIKDKFFERNSFITVKLAKNKSLVEGMEALEALWKESFSDAPMHYSFLDERYNQQYQSEVLFGKVFGLFSGLAIFIACLGLLGFIAYSVQQRTKEIGIRKVLGASISQILVLLSKDYIRLILVACVIALPIAYFLIQRWMEGFAYKTDLLWWLFAAPGVMVLVIALLSVSGQAIRAVLANPVDSLKYE